jgi:hypothetical protein
MYFNYASPDNSTLVNFRPIYVGVKRDGNTSHAAHVFFDIGTEGFPNSHMLVQAGAGNTILTVIGNLVSIASGVKLQVGGANVKTAPSSALTEFCINGQNPLSTTRVLQTLYGGAVQIENPVTLTGIVVPNAGTVSGSLIVALYDSVGARMAQSAPAGTHQAGSFTSQFVPFTGTVTAAPGLYYICLISSSSMATFSTVQTFTNGIATLQATFAAPSSITAPAVKSTQLVPALSTF